MGYIRFFCVFAYVVSCMGRCNASKNVLFIISDDLRPELGCYYETGSQIHPGIYTPNIDSLASKSLLLKRAYVQQAVCGPSRTSMLTGRRPETTRVYDLETYWRDAAATGVTGNFTTLPQYFKENGYTTVGMGKIFHPGSASGFDDPISWTEDYYSADSNFESNQKSWNSISSRMMRNTGKLLQDQSITEHALRLLEEYASSNTNFFMAVGFHKPHLPFVSPDWAYDLYPEADILDVSNPFAPWNMPDVAWFKYPELIGFSDIAKLGATGDINTTLPDDTTRALRRAYYSAVSYIDDLVGTLVDKTVELGIDKQTVIVFMGDHGFQLGEHGLWTKNTNFEIATHAPLMIHVPGQTEAGVVSNSLVEFVDVFPTVVEAAGLTTIDRCAAESSESTQLCHEGTSLMPLVSAPEMDLKLGAFSQYPRQTDIMGYSIRTDQFRYTEWVQFDSSTNTPDWDTSSGTELYDHDIDPEENYNVHGYSSYATAEALLQIMLRNGWRDASIL